MINAALRVATWIGVVGCACATAACSADTSPSTIADTGTPGTDSAVSDTGRTDSGGADTPTPVTPPATDVSFEADFIGKNGPYFITGTVTLPPGAEAGRAIQIEVIRVGGGNQVGPAGRTIAGGTFTYKVTALEAGAYKIGVRVDQTNNLMVNDPGDYIGFARGTTASPKTTSSAADEITVGAPVTGVDFGLGVAP